MSNKVEYVYHIWVGEPDHIWYMVEKGGPVPRYDCLRSTIVNGVVVEQPSAHQLKQCLSKFYTNKKECFDEVAALNKAWNMTDPRHSSYDPDFVYTFPEPDHE